MLQAKNITIQLGRKTLLQNVELCILPGQITALVGPNGAGKSTLMGVLCGDRPAQKGTVTLDGRPLSAWPLGQLALRRAVVTQHSALSFPFRVEEVVRMGRMPHRPNDPEAEEQLLVSLLRAVGMLERRHQTYTTLSGGERQRVHMARALAQLARPQTQGPARYLLLDEPTASLDPAHALMLLELVQRVAQEKIGVLAVMHDLNLASIFADQVVMLGQGRVLAQGPPRQVITRERLDEAFGYPACVTPHPHSALPMVVPPASDRHPHTHHHTLLSTKPMGEPS